MSAELDATATAATPAPEQKKPLQILLLAGALPDEENAGMGIADAEDDVGAPLRQRAGGAGTAGGMQSFPVRGHTITSCLLLYQVFRNIATAGRNLDLKSHGGCGTMKTMTGKEVLYYG